MAKSSKRITANTTSARLQKRYREYGQRSKLQDICAEHVSEDELVEISKFTLSELRRRHKQYALKSTKEHIEELQRYYDLAHNAEQYDRALNYSIQHLEVLISVFSNQDALESRKKFVLEEARNFVKLLKQFRKK